MPPNLFSAYFFCLAAFVGGVSKSPARPCSLSNRLKCDCAHNGNGAVPVSQCDTATLLKPVASAKSVCFQPNISSPALNSSVVIASPIINK